MRLFSFLTICTGIHAQLEEKQEFEFEVYHRGGPEKIYTWREAKNFCQTLHDGWQLVIVNSPTKQKAIDEAFIAAGAQDDDALWIGFMNEDGWGANSADAQLTTDLYGNRAVYTNYGPGEPNNKRGSPKDERGENCVRMRYKKGKTFWEDALCGRGDTFKSRKGKKAYKNSFACEPRKVENSLLQNKSQ